MISVVLAGFVTYLMWRYQVFAAAPGDQVRNALGVVAQISATMLGFLLAALAILASISGHRLLREMQRLGHYRVLLRVIYVDSLVFGLTMALGIAGLILPCYLGVAALLTHAIFVLAVILLVDVAWRFWVVLSNLSP